MTNLPNNTPSEQPTSQRASSSPSRQSLESETRTILLKFLDDNDGLWDQFMEGDDPDPEKYDEMSDNATNDAQATLLKTVDRYVEEQLKQLKRHKVQTYSHMISFVDQKHHIKPDIEAVPIKYIDEQIAALRQQVKEGE